MSLENVIKFHRSDDGDSYNKVDTMSSETITKDWIEKRIQDVDHQRELDRKEWQADLKDMNHNFTLALAKSDEKFERAREESNAKFEKLFAEMRFESEKNTLKIESAISRAQLQIVMWVIATSLTVTFGALKFFSPPSQPVTTISTTKNEVPTTGKPVQP